MAPNRGRSVYSAMKSDFFARRALVVLCVLFFLVPFAMRGARMSWERMETNVKDWLPGNFEETRELAWFGEHFSGEQAAVVLTWEGCSEADESYRLFVEKLRNEIRPAEGENGGVPPAAAAEVAEVASAEAGDAAAEADAEVLRQRARELERARLVGDELGLFLADHDYFNWGGLNEKWLRGAGHSWYYITPAGELYRWSGRSNILSVASRLFQRHVLGHLRLDGTLVEQLGQSPTARSTNGFHDNPQRLTARVLRSVTTGPEVLAALSAPGGPLWPAEMEGTDATRAQVARRAALDRLEGTFFGPEPYAQFAWTAEDLPRVVSATTLQQLPKGWQKTVDAYIANLLDTQYAGLRSELVAESLLKKEEHWNAMFDAVGVEPPGLQTCILVTLTEAGLHDLDRVMGRGLFGRPRGKLVNLAVESGVLAPPKPPLSPFAERAVADGKVLRLSGPAVDNVAFDEEGQITLVRLVISLVVVSLVVSYLCFRQITAALLVLGVSAVSALASLAIVWWTGSRVDAVLWLMPLVVFVLGLGGSTYLLGYYREISRVQGLERAPARALAQAAAPCVLATVTMAAGLFALCVSQNHPIRKFGFFGALGVLAAFVVLFTFLPSALQLWPLRPARPPAAGSSFAGRLVRWTWHALGDLAIEHNWLVASTAVGLMIFLGWNLGQLHTSVRPLSLFGPDTKIIHDYAWLEKQVGKPVPMELVITVDKQCQSPVGDPSQPLPPRSSAADTGGVSRYSFLERIELVAHVQNAVDRVFGRVGNDLLGPTLSAVSFAPPIGDPLDARRADTNAALERQRDLLRRQGYLTLTDAGTELWRINMRLSALNDVDYGQFVNQLKQVVEPVLRAYEIRDEILRQVAAQRPDADADETRWNDTKIAVLGASDPRDDADDITAAVELPELRPRGGRLTRSQILENEHRMLGVHREFARVLSDLLRAKGYQGRRGGRTPSQYVAWQNPRKNPLGENARSDAWAKNLASFDCVVVLRDHADYDIDFIRQHAKCFVDAREHTFDPASSQTARQLDKPLAVTYTGMVPVLYQTQQTLLQSLIDTAWWAFVVIAVVMMFAVRTRKFQLPQVLGGLVAMLPALFTVIVVFGDLARRGLTIDLGTVMTVGLAMGVTVVGTFEFLIWYRRAVLRGLERTAAVQAAFREGSGTILQTTVVVGLGLVMFALGTFVPTQRFGLTMLALVLTALVANLALLPALLAGPLGRYLSPRVPALSADEAVVPMSRASRTFPACGSSGAAAAGGAMHITPRDGRTSTLVRRDGSHT